MPPAQTTAEHVREAFDLLEGDVPDPSQWEDDTDFRDHYEAFLRHNGVTAEAYEAVRVIGDSFYDDFVHPLLARAAVDDPAAIMGIVERTFKSGVTTGFALGVVAGLRAQGRDD